MKTTVLLDNYLKTLRLPTFLREYAAVARECSRKDSSYADTISLAYNKE